MSTRQLIVIGGGAAGFFCAVNAARMNPQLKVLILEKTGKLLSKVRITGGGRCNVTHAVFEIDALSKRYPRGQHFVKKSFHQFFTTDTIQWFESRGVRLKAEEDGRMFPVTDNSETIIGCLMQEASLYGVDIRMHAEVREIKLLQKEAAHAGFELVLNPSTSIKADYICIATGGYPKLGMFEWLTVLGHSLQHPVPSLFTFNLPDHPITKLMGVSAEGVRVKIEGTKLSEEGPLLVTHWGLSGPAVLKLSAWGARTLAEKQYHFKAHINWCPDETELTLKEQMQQARNTHATRKMINHNFTSLPSRLWQFILGASGIDEAVRIADLPMKAENALIRNLTDYVVEVKGKTTYKEEFVTAGGISLNEVDPNTLMSRKIPNLFFAGEILDVDGVTGGFNFQHAWTSGWLAAKSIAELKGE